MGKHCGVTIPKQGAPSLARRVIDSLQAGCRDIASALGPLIPDRKALRAFDHFLFSFLYLFIARY